VAVRLAGESIMFITRITVDIDDYPTSVVPADVTALCVHGVEADECRDITSACRTLFRPEPSGRLDVH